MNPRIRSTTSSMAEPYSCQIKAVVLSKPPQRGFRRSGCQCQRPSPEVVPTERHTNQSDVIRLTRPSPAGLRNDPPSVAVIDAFKFADGATFSRAFSVVSADATGTCVDSSLCFVLTPSSASPLAHCNRTTYLSHHKHVYPSILVSIRHCPAWPLAFHLNVPSWLVHPHRLSPCSCRLPNCSP